MNRYEALKHAVKAHAGQLDKCGKPYVLHPIAVAEAAARHGRSATVSVEVADLWHNLRSERQACLPCKEQMSLESRYKTARDRIWEGLGYEWWPQTESEEG